MKPFFLLCLVVVSCSLSLCPSASASDWPMYRGDAGRRGVTPDNLGENLTLTWKRELPKLTPAFKDDRLQFDAGYEPVIANGVLLVASSQTDSVTAYDTKTGKERWVFYTDGPVRLAPAISQGSACFGSDDGCMYCVDLLTGELLWKHRAAPSQRRLLGNKRLISVWPIRGGPVVADGKVYFAAGVWPFEGVFVYAMEIATGKVLWRNDRLGTMFGKQPHNTQAIGGLAPQGYLLINEEELVVPCSNAYPARLNRHTGELIEFELPTAGRVPGGWFAAIDPDKARAIRRGALTFDEVINRHLHEDKLNHSNGGIKGLSREIRTANTTLQFDDSRDGIAGTVHSMVVADDALFVTTREGQLLCFRSSGSEHAEAAEKNRTWKQTTVSLDSIVPLDTTDEATSTATTVLEHASSNHGLAVVVGLTDGRLTKALIDSSQYHVVIIDDNSDRVRTLRNELVKAGLYGNRAAVILADLHHLELPPYVTTTLISERTDVAFLPLLQTLRPFGGMAFGGMALGGMALGGQITKDSLKNIEPGSFSIKASTIAGLSAVRRIGPLPGATQYSGEFALSRDELVRFPLGVLWFDDELAHFKRSPQPIFEEGTMISRPKNWHVPRNSESNKVDYPLLPPVLSDIYTGRIFDDSEQTELRKNLNPSPTTALEPSQYRTEGQAFSTKSGPLVAGQRINPLTGESEPRIFPKTYGCDGGIDYGDFYTLRSGTAAYYDKTIESGTVFLSGPRSGCTNSVIPSGGLLNVPYYYDGCTCSYPLPVAMSLVAMPQRHEQWSSWGQSEIGPGKLQRIGINFGAPGDRMTREGTLWLDYPSVGGPSPQVKIESNPSTRYTYRHSMFVSGDEPRPWVSASMAVGLKRLVIKDLKPGKYLVRLYFAQPARLRDSNIENNVELEDKSKLEDKSSVQEIQLQGQAVLQNFDIAKEADGVMKSIVREFADIDVQGDLTLDLKSKTGETHISGIELIRQ